MFFQTSRPMRRKDGDRISHLRSRYGEWLRRHSLFDAEVDALMQRVCLERFGHCPLIPIAVIKVNGRKYYYKITFFGNLSVSWVRAVVGDINECDLDAVEH